MILSLNEVEALAKKATRGAGYSWGLAEEAARATRWLCAHGLDGAASLAARLARADGTALNRWSVQDPSGDWTGAAGGLCPLMAGATLGDFAVRLRQVPVRMTRVAEPLLLLPFAACAARHLGSATSVEWTGLTATTDGAHLALVADRNAPAASIAQQVIVQTCPGPHAPVAQTTRATLDQRDWQILDRFAARTYASATEQSRLLGAGTGTSDND